MTEVTERVRKVVARQFKVSETDISSETNFRVDLGVDSLGKVELAMAFEKEFGIEITDQDVEATTTVGHAQGDTPLTCWGAFFAVRLKSLSGCVGGMRSSCASANAPSPRDILLTNPISSTDDVLGSHDSIENDIRRTGSGHTSANCSNIWDHIQ